MNDSQWNYYAAQELAGMLARDGLCCPSCEQLTTNMNRTDDDRFHCNFCSSEFSPAEYHAAKRRPLKPGLSTLYRPVGEKELAKIEKTEFTKFPPRLQWQPIFYPVLTQDYADAIARDWNSKDADHNYVGYVTKFQIRNEYLCNYEIQTAADNDTLEYWIPAEDVDSFNENIVGKISVVAEFRNGELVRSSTQPEIGT